MNIFRSKSLVFTALGALILGAGLAILVKPPRESGQFVEVKRGTIVETVDVTGKVKAEEHVDLAFESRDRMERIFRYKG